jgi:hypothetical protein
VKLVLELSLAPWSRLIGGINRFPVTYSEDGVYSSTANICNITLLSQCKPKLLFESASYCTVSDFEVNGHMWFRRQDNLCMVE